MALVLLFMRYQRKIKHIPIEMTVHTKRSEIVLTRNDTDKLVENYVTHCMSLVFLCLE